MQDRELQRMQSEQQALMQQLEAAKKELELETEAFQATQEVQQQKMQVYSRSHTWALRKNTKKRQSKSTETRKGQ